MLFNIGDIVPILAERKTSTARYYPLTVGRIYKCCVGCLPYFATVRVTRVTKKDVRELTREDVLKLGYKTRKQYLNEPFNKNGEYIKYINEFELIQTNFNEFIQTYKKH